MFQYAFYSCDIIFHISKMRKLYLRFKLMRCVHWCYDNDGLNVFKISMRSIFFNIKPKNDYRSIIYQMLTVPF